MHLALNYKNMKPRNSALLDSEDLEQKLVNLGKYRDKQLFLPIYDHFAPRLKSHLMSHGAHSEQAEELVQEAMLAVWKHCGTFNPDKATASTWIFRITRNLWIDRMRKDKSHLLSPIDNYPDPAFTPSLAFADGKILKNAITSLPQSQAQLVYKVYYEGKTHKEIADECEIPLGSVKSGLRLAFEKLRKYTGGGL
ncbi:sigma-70 family RNA polymerase sigma factor [Parendozoicomonas sp. Alg238-R29]|uniref:sigma-70 family RNA polymerase sigma factor n=1 Tax=Parendozoicomonas sp. Alg238-R29 TaxID=2993446 RepID=UPI00248EDFE2|nr:sigma-70 family RNA polymerase sigma factor [Parendozoicomonas sp. Alg238-R29]